MNFAEIVRVRRAPDTSAEHLERIPRGMADYVSFDTTSETTLSRIIAESLIARDGPQDIFEKAEKLGFSPVASQVAVTACAQTACDQADRVQSVGFGARR